MGLKKLFLISAFVGVLSVLGCGDSGGSESASSVCSACDAQDRIPACEERYDECRALDPAGEECAVFALEQCGAL